MPANTPLFAFPYPLGTDRVADGDDAIHALALAVEGQMSGTAGTPSGPYRMAAGRVSVTPPAGGAGVSVAVTFPSGRFTQPPIVTVGVGSNGYGSPGMGIASMTGTQVRYWNPTNVVPTNPECTWIAVQMSPTAAPGLFAAEPDNAVATCHTDGCENAGQPIPLYLDELVSAVFCGVCEQPITDLDDNR